MSIDRSDLLRLVCAVRFLRRLAIYATVEATGHPRDGLITIEEKTYILEDRIHDLIERVTRD